MSRDMPHEAKILVKRMRSDSKVDIQQHWKIVTILIGPNDFCSDFCYQAYPERTHENHRRELIETLRILRDNLPRTIVNVVTPPSKFTTFRSIIRKSITQDLYCRYESDLSNARKAKGMHNLQSFRMPLCIWI